MNTKKFILATDLDGTFLGGSEKDRFELYDWIERSRTDIGLIFVTGRDQKFIESLCRDAVPWPDYVVGDVGTTIAEVLCDAPSKYSSRRLRPIEALEAEIKERWGDAASRIETTLASAAGLKPQKTVFRHRMSYHYDPAAYDSSAESKVKALGFDVLISDNLYFDVLPKGVSKGPSLRRLLHHLGVDDDRVLVAGDTLNDMSLFETGLRGVAVANSEPALLSRIDAMPSVFRASRAGAAGIAEAIRHFSFNSVTGAAS